MNANVAGFDGEGRGLDDRAFSEIGAAWNAAYWAAASAHAAWFLGLLSLAIGGVTLFLLKRQLDANRQALLDAARSADAAAEATRIAVASSRPWLKASPNNVAAVTRILDASGRSRGNVELPVFIENVGKTPALDVRVSLDWLTGTMEDQILAALDAPANTEIVLGTMFPADTKHQTVFATVAKLDGPKDVVAKLMLLRVRYRMSGSDHFHRTVHVVFCGGPAPDPMPQTFTLPLGVWSPHLTNPT